MRRDLSMPPPQLAETYWPHPFQFVIVILGREDYDLAMRKGLERQERNEKQHLRHRYGGDLHFRTRAKAIETHRRAVASEIAVHRFTGSTLPKDLAKRPPRSKPDVPPDLQVKCPDDVNVNLPVNEDANPSQRYVLVWQGRQRRYQFAIVGWIRGADAMQQHYWHPGQQQKRPFFLVPPKDLVTPAWDLEGINLPQEARP